MQKVYEISLDLYDVRNYSNLLFGQYDKGNTIHISFTERGEAFPLTDITALVKLNDSYQLHGVCANDILTVILPQSAVSVLGQNKLTVSLYDAHDNVVTMQNVFYTVREGVGKLEELTEDSTLGQQILSNMAAFQAAENQRVINEAKRVESETERGAREAERIEAENGRMEAETAREAGEQERASAEDERIAAEEIRAETETSRLINDALCEEHEAVRKQQETLRVTAEQSRIEAEEARRQAESNRDLNEAKRVESETERGVQEAERIEAENGRMEAETAREAGEQERASAEDARIAAEEGRKAAETARIAAEEGRQATETARIAAEAERQAAYREVSKLYANAIKGTVEGAAVRMDDVSPIEHEMDVVVSSENILSSEKFEYLTNENGTTTVRQDDGSLHIQGTLTQFVFVNISPRFPLPKGTYTYSIITDSTDIFAGAFHYDDAGKQTTLCDNKRSVTFESDGTGKYLFQFRTMPSGTLDNTIYCMLEKGVNTSPVYKKHIPDVSSVKLKKYSRNLLTYPDVSRVDEGITFTDNRDGTITANGTATGLAWHKDITIQLLRGATYTISGCPAGGGSGTYRITMFYTQADGQLKYITDTGNGVTFTMPTDAVDAVLTIRFTVVSGVTVTNLVFKPQVELGSKKTPFEKYKEPQTCSVNTDGTVEGITSISPTATLIPDTSWTIVTCTYNKDTNKVIEQLTQAIISLGGNV